MRGRPRDFLNQGCPQRLVLRNLFLLEYLPIFHLPLLQMPFNHKCSIVSQRIFFPQVSFLIIWQILPSIRHGSHKTLLRDLYLKSVGWFRGVGVWGGRLTAQAWQPEFKPPLFAILLRAFLVRSCKMAHWNPTNSGLHFWLSRVY